MTHASISSRVEGNHRFGTRNKTMVENISALGLVSIPRGSFYLVAEFLGLVVLLGAVYAAAFLALEWSSFVTNN